MLVHRVSAFFGMDHNVDGNGSAVVVCKTKGTRIPDIKFGDYIKDALLPHEPKKSILKRDSASLDESNNPLDLKDRSPDRQILVNSRSKSFEEREERYQKTRARIFNQDSTSSAEGSEFSSIQIDLDSSSCNGDSSNMPRNSSPNQDEGRQNWTSDPRPWSSTDSDSSGRPNKGKQFRLTNSLDSDTSKSGCMSSGSSSSGMMLLSPDTLISDNLKTNKPQRVSLTKASSFGGISGPVDKIQDAKSTSASKLTKSGSFNVSETCVPLLNSTISHISSNSGFKKNNAQSNNFQQPKFTHPNPSQINQSWTVNKEVTTSAWSNLANNSYSGKCYKSTVFHDF